MIVGRIENKYKRRAVCVILFVPVVAFGVFTQAAAVVKEVYNATVSVW